MIKQIEFSEKDFQIAKSIDVDQEDLKNDHFDYSGVVVKKPWGQEYLIFQKRKRGHLGSYK